MLWYAGDFHSHTVHSDGALTVPELAWLACDEGLDFLAVTDHNTVSHHPELPAVGARYGIRLLPGQEVTRDEGHANVFGDTGWVDFRQPADSWYQHARTHGGVMSLNHPLGSDCAWRLPLADRPRHAEVWHSGWFDRRWGRRCPGPRHGGLMSSPSAAATSTATATTGGPAPPPPGCSPKTTAPQPCSLPWRPGVRRSPRAPVRPCCCGSGTNFSRSAPKAPHSSAPTDGAGSSTRTAPPFPLRAGCTVWKVTRTR